MKKKQIRAKVNILRHTIPTSIREVIVDFLARDLTSKVLDKLRALRKDKRTHRDLVAELENSLHKQYPSPYASAIETIALAQGWNPECLQACLMCNTAFLENHKTSLSLDAFSTHSVSPNIPVFIAAMSSARKSSLIHYTNQTLLAGNPHAPPCFLCKDIYFNDATLKGIRNCLVKHSRCSLSSDEAV